MFDRALIIGGGASHHHHNHHSTVVEKRAPTDESVRLLKDFEAEAKGKVLDSIRLTENGFECIVHQYVELVNDQQIFIAIFNLNGKKMDAEYRIQRFECRGQEWHRKVADGLLKAISEKIATQALQPLAVALHDKFGGFRGH